MPGKITSQQGWTEARVTALLRDLIPRLKASGIRVSLFVDPTEEAVRLAASLGANRVELYTEPFARAFERSPEMAAEVFDAYARAATLAHTEGLGVNAGHDLDLDNLKLFRRLPYLDEVSIGHAVISRAIFVGLDRVVREYVALLAEEPQSVVSRG
jgi:pyridoxine 5-phosphate synthase